MSDSNKIIKIAVIGCGERGRLVTNNLFKDSDGNVKVVSLFEPDLDVAKQSVKTWDEKDVKICDSYQEAIDTDGVEWVMVFSPNVYHKEHITYAFERKKHVLPKSR